MVGGREMMGDETDDGCEVPIQETAGYVAAAGLLELSVEAEVQKVVLPQQDLQDLLQLDDGQTSLRETPLCLQVPRRDIVSK